MYEKRTEDCSLFLLTAIVFIKLVAVSKKSLTLLGWAEYERCSPLNSSCWDPSNFGPQELLPFTVFTFWNKVAVGSFNSGKLPLVPRPYWFWYFGNTKGESNIVFVVYEIPNPLSKAPFFVVIMITPFEAREPYSAGKKTALLVDQL